MPDIYRPKLGAKNLHSSLKGMAEFRGAKISDRRLKEVLLNSGDKDLRNFAYQKSGKTTAHQAQKIIKKFAKHVSEHENMDFSYSAKRQGIGQLSRAGRISDIATKNLYQETAKREMLAEKPKGPTPEELRQKKIQEERIRQRNISNRRMANESEPKQKNKEGITSIADRQKRENVQDAQENAKPEEQQHSPSIRMPMMSGGVPRSRVAPQNLDRFSSESFERERPIDTTEETPQEALDESTEEPVFDEESTPQTPESPPKPSEDSGEQDIDKGLPFGE